MRKYELTAVFSGTISDTDLGLAVDRVQKLLTDAGAVTPERGQLGKHKLQYEIDGNKFGHIETFTFECETGSASVISKKLKLSKEVVRFVLESFNAARLKRQPQIADTALIKASREREREERENARDDRRGGGERNTGDRADHSPAPMLFAAGHVEKSEPAPAHDKPVDLEEIDKKLDQLLQGDLTPAV
ncbi:MAG: hypothetical protein A2848_01410 [Candidatus Magasanikbacteria bacterium RIFCSPHIGHO2_01_FULL_50_8]|uniref:Small ribosomal subunit protein bS6 n=1 Tax=Candidatus Magasanikbacteria bacterium RIFCSPHIGHO2_01_FULL_50_8 TaxID=1798674 RepID=A0A1F6LRY7_9BACT|nr:MAG: hypothetical protein A2848_01410 [Candidatus Magasanikbacteria bacterium RIFCSPHIGHO2_01_FULL_50_8]